MNNSFIVNIIVNKISVVFFDDQFPDSLANPEPDNQIYTCETYNCRSDCHVTGI